MRNRGCVATSEEIRLKRLLTKRVANFTIYHKKNNAKSALIKIDDFKKIDLRVGRILHAERIQKSEKLLVFQIDFGEIGKRQIISGIAQFYTPEELIGKKIVAIVNLKPTKIMGVESCGMLLTTEDSSGVKLLFAESSAGNKIS